MMSKRSIVRHGGGPKTEQGKAVASKNALSHGIFAANPVLPIVEDATHWDSHRATLLRQLAPVGAIEEALAERAALMLWRLNRVARFERETLANELEKAKPFYDFDAGAEEEVSCAAEWLGEVRGFATLPPSKRISADSALTVLHFVSSEFDAVALVPPGVDPEDYDGWTVNLVNSAIAELAKASGTGSDDMIAVAITKAERGLVKAERKLASQAEQLRSYRSRHLVAVREVDLIMRYESHLERSLHKTLGQLERYQAMRAGAPVSLPLVVDVNVNGG